LLGSRFCAESAAIARDRLPFGPEARSNEADIPAEQPEAEADPRLPRAHADQGRPPGAEAAAAEGSEEDRGLTGRPARGASLRPRERLRSGADYRRVLRRGDRVHGPLLTLVACDNDLGYDRLGLAASRRLGGAVARNRAKRLLREAFRRHKRAPARGADVVALPRPELLAHSQAEVDREYTDLLARLERKRRARPGGKGPHPAG
jgi:ribonuclease P protein component